MTGASGVAPAAPPGERLGTREAKVTTEEEKMVMTR